MHPLAPPLTLPNGVAVPLSPAIQTGGLVFVSGQLGFCADGSGLVAGGIREQTGAALDNIERLLNEADLSLENIVKITGWLTRPEDFSEFNAVYAERFGAVPPARSMVVSQLLIPGALVELEAIAEVESFT
ncbi:RidA family protein [uncultured Algimonas sp.]|uniref:RidA family protein n=1 Tax=uncultured Algimonas sp. TaxID=1547920 RepID=UPI00262E5BF2|nr:RidA family protein [uncultured Algimonas sp.]